MDECRQRGKPLLPAELARFYPPVPDDENAAVALLKLWSESSPGFWGAFAAGERPGRHTTHDPLLTNVLFLSPDLPADSCRRTWEPVPEEAEPPVFSLDPLDERVLAPARRHLQERDAYIRDLIEAVSKPHCRFPLRFEEGNMIRLAHLSEAKGDACLLRLHALTAAELGNTSEAAADVEHIARIAKHLSEEPLLMSQTISTSVAGMACTSLEEVVSRRALDAESLERISDALGFYSATNALRVGLMERRTSIAGCYGMADADLATHLNQGIGDLVASFRINLIGEVFLFSRWSGLRQMDHSIVLKTLRKADEALLAGESRMPALLESAFKDGEAEAAAISRRLFSDVILGMTTGQFTSPFKTEARLRAARLAIEFELYRILHGRWPQTIGELELPADSSIATDPFTGEPMKVRQLKHGFVIYSLGPDRTDEGGRGMLKSPGAPYDISFTLERKDATE